MSETPAIEPLHIKGDCRASDLSEADRNRLTSVSGDLFALNSTGLTLPLLERVGGSLFADNSTSLTLPSLTSVEGDLNAGGSTNLTLPSLKSCDTLDAEDSTGLVIPSAIARQHRIPAECLAVVPEQSHAEKAIAELQNANESQNQGIK